MKRGVGDPAIRSRYCFTPVALLKWIIIIISCVVLALICWKNERTAGNLYQGELYTIIVAALTVGILFAFLLAFFLNCHNTAFASCHCRALATWIYLIFLCLWIAAAAVQVWVAVELGRSGHDDYKNDFFNRRCAAAAFAILNAILFAFALHQSRLVDL